MFWKFIIRGFFLTYKVYIYKENKVFKVYYIKNDFTFI